MKPPTSGVTLDRAPDDPSFGGVRYSSGRGLLLDAAGAVIPLRRQSLAVFRHLAARAGRLVTREELMRAVWGRVRVTEDSLTQCVLEIRRVLDGDGHAILRTLPRRGYLLVADVPVRTRPAPVGSPLAGSVRAVGREPARATATPVPARRPRSCRHRRRRTRSTQTSSASG